MGKAKKKALNKGTILKKYLAGENLYKYEEDYLWKKLKVDADKVCSEYIRFRDRNKGCVTCGGPVQHNAHWISRAWYSHRWDEDNCAGACANCNTYNQEEHKVLYTVHQTKTHGERWVDVQLVERHKIKPSISYLLEIIDKYKQKLSLEKGK